MKDFYRIDASTDPAIADIHIIDFIGDWADNYFGFGETAKAFIGKLGALADTVKTIRVHLNSPGGDVSAAINIANALRDQSRTKGRVVETVVDGMAASAATLVMVAGDKISVADNALVMVHNPSTLAWGTADDMRQTADMLDTFRDTIVSTYQWVSNLSAKDLQKLMDAETWMTADEAIANGLATDKIAGAQAVASISRRPWNKVALKVPEQFKDRVESLLAPEDTGIEDASTKEPASGTLPHVDVAEATISAEDLLSLWPEMPAAFARDLLRDKVTRAEAEARINQERARLQAEAARKSEITDLCSKFKQPALAQDLISEGVSATGARKIVLTMTALVDVAKVDSSLLPDVKKVVDLASNVVYEARRRKGR